MTTIELSLAQRTAVEDAVQRFGFDTAERADYLNRLAQADDIQREILLCAGSSYYFITQYCMIYDAQAQDWIPFDLWEQQKEVLEVFDESQLSIVLKARQLGMTWLALGYALWLMLFRPIATVMLFSRRDDEAMYLISYDRMKGIYKRLPDFLKSRSAFVNNKHQLSLSNGSVAYAFPTSAGDSYTASLVIVDEADLIPDLNQVMRAAKPTISAGGKMILISRANKSLPNSEFKRIYRAAKANLNPWSDVFLPWWVRPERNEDWYREQHDDILQRTGSLDELHEQYPATDAEALAPQSLDKRIPPDWIDHCYRESAVIDDLPQSIAALPVKVFRKPERGRRYAIGMDCAEGLPTSDDSATTIIDADTGEEVANLIGKFTPAVHAAYTARLSTWYRKATIMPESNNHGHAAILWFNDNGYRTRVAKGHNKKRGWTSSTLGKVLMYDDLAQAAKDGEITIHDFETMLQIKSIEKGTLRAPPGDLDDRSDSYALALQAAKSRPASGNIVVLSEGKRT